MKLSEIAGTAKGLLFILAGVLAICRPDNARAQSLLDELPPEVAEEIRYIQGLNKLQMPKYSEIVLQRLESEHPDIKATIEVLKIEQLLMLGKFPEVEQIIAGQADKDSGETWAMKTTMADYLFAWNKYKEAMAIYEEFFKRFPDKPTAELETFYFRSAYKYGQMLILMNRDKDALKAYDYMLKTNVAEGEKRRILSEKGALLLRVAQQTPAGERSKYFEEIRKIAEDTLVWKQDLWFGKGIVLMAYAQKLQGNIAGADKLIEEHKDTLMAIDKVLAEEEESTGNPVRRLSPLAECRYLVGSIKMDEAERILQSGGDKAQVKDLLLGKKDGDKMVPGAVQHFANVFINYPGSTWAPDASQRYDRAKDIIKREFGADLNIPGVTPAKMEAVRAEQFQQARLLYTQQQYKEAVESYVKVLNAYPECSESVPALFVLAKCYLELSQQYHSDMVVSYLAERFSKNSAYMIDAGDKLVALALYYGQQKQPEKRDEVYQLFFSNFTRHPRSASTLITFAHRDFQAKNYEKAIESYQRIADDFRNSPAYFTALDQLAFCYKELGDRDTEMKILERIIDELSKTSTADAKLIKARYRLAFRKYEMGGEHIPEAIKEFSMIVKLLENENLTKNWSETEKAVNEEIGVAAFFYTATAYAKIKEPPKEAEESQKKAIKLFDQMIQKYPSHEKYIAQALLQKAALHAIMGEDAKTQDALRTLKTKYPQTEAAQRSVFLYADALEKMGRRKEAVAAYKEMIQGGSEYALPQVLSAGAALFTAGEYETAILAYDRILAEAKEPILIEPALLGKGQALCKMGKFDEAVQALEKVLEDFPKSTSVIDASVSLAKTYAELAKVKTDEVDRVNTFNKAVKALKKARRYVDPGMKAMLDLLAGEISELKAEAEAQFGTPENVRSYRKEAAATYLTMILFADKNDAGVRNHLQEAYHRCVSLLVELEQWDEVYENARQYIELFKNGKYIVDMRRWRGMAATKGAGGSEEPAPGTDEPEVQDQPEQTGPAEAEQPPPKVEGKE